MSIIELNGKQFAKGKSGLVDTLFNPKGSADGFYTVKLDGIALHKPDGGHIATINRHGVLCCASKLPDGKTWYTHADPEIVGKYESYMRKVDETTRALEIAGIEKISERW